MHPLMEDGVADGLFDSLCFNEHQLPKVVATLACPHSSWPFEMT